MVGRHTAVSITIEALTHIFHYLMRVDIHQLFPSDLEILSELVGILPNILWALNQLEVLN